jgi:hypothetical protein
MAYKALLVVNWEYRDPAKVLTPLKGPRNDLKAMRDALTHSSFGLFDENNVRCFENVTRADMPIIFYEFLYGAGKDDSLLLYFSGHGERRLSDERLALCGVDTDHKRLEPTSFDTSALRTWIEQFNRAPSTIVVLDCCYAGQMKGSLNEQSVIGSLGAGTMVLGSGRNRPAQDADNASDPSPFTAALAKILLDPEEKGDQRGWVTADAVYERLIRLDPPLLPAPYRNVQSQGTFVLAKREAPPTLTREELKGFQVPESVEVIELKFGAETVAARWETGRSETLKLTALDDHRQTAMRRLAQLADAVLRIPEYADDHWYQLAVQQTWNCVGVNLFETAIPRGLRKRLSSGIDGTGRHLLKLRLSFEEAATCPLEPYPWEHLQIGSVPGAKPPGGDELLPLALRPGLLIERVAPVGVPPSGSRPSKATSTAGVVNCLQDKFALAAARIAEDLTKLPELNVIMDLKAGSARWGPFLDALTWHSPRLLLLCASLRSGAQGVELGFVPDEPGEPEWHRGTELTSELHKAGLHFDAIVFMTFSAKPGQDSFHGTIEFAQALARSGVGPVVFVCHAPGFDAPILNRQRDAFPVLFIDALTRGTPLDQAFYYAKNRVIRMGNEAVRRTFGVPGYYVHAPTEPRSALSAPVTKGGRTSAAAERQRRPSTPAPRDERHE